MLAYAARNELCSVFVKKYFEKSTQLPADMLEVGDLYRKMVSSDFSEIPYSQKKICIF